MDDPITSTSTSPSTPQSPLWYAMQRPADPENDPGNAVNNPTVLYGSKGDDNNGNPITNPLKQGKDNSLSVETNPKTQAANDANNADLVTVLNSVVTAINNIPTIAHGDAATITLNSPFSTIGVSRTDVILKSPSGTFTDVYLDGLLQSRTSGT